MKKLLLLIGAGVGYVMGTKAGRQRYEQLRSAARKVKDDPRVQEKSHQAAEQAKVRVQQATDLAKEKAPVVKEKLAGAAGAVSSKVSSSSTNDDLVEQLHPDSTARQEAPYPQGDLP